MPKTSDITIRVKLNEDSVPETIQWSADSSGGEMENCEAFMLGIWDAKNAETLRIDLWTNEMRTDEMDKFMFQTFLTMADTYSRANQNEEMTKYIRDFAYMFGEKSGLIKRK
ncbi:MAG: gliding motility protein GldC [Chitinophagales bacterium]